VADPSDLPLRKLREALDLTQDELAAAARVGAGHLSLIERGKRRPKYNRLQRIFDALNASDRDRARVIAWLATTYEEGELAA